MTTVLLEGEDKVTVVTEVGDLVMTQISEQRLVIAVRAAGPEPTPIPPPAPVIELDPRVRPEPRPSPLPVEPRPRPGGTVPPNTMPPVPIPDTGENWLPNGYLMDAAGNASFEFWETKNGYFFNPSIQPGSGGLHEPLLDWATVCPVAWGLQCDWDFVNGVPSRRNTWPQSVGGAMVEDEAWTIVDNPPPHEEYVDLFFAEGGHMDDVLGSQYQGLAVLRLDAMMDDDEDWTNLATHTGVQSPIGTGHPNPATPGPDLPATYNLHVDISEHGHWDVYRVWVKGGLKGKNAGFVWAGFTLTGK